MSDPIKRYCCLAHPDDGIIEAKAVEEARSLLDCQNCTSISGNPMPMNEDCEDLQEIIFQSQVRHLEKENATLKDINKEMREALEAHCETCKTEWDFHQSWCDCCGYHKTIRKAKGEGK